jgi:dephospho-CoA kinase
MTAAMHLFGLTGGIASGKSSVARVWRDLGLPIIDADVLAREVVMPGAPALADIRAEFGDSVLAPDGTLDRKALAAIVFADDAKRRRLNQLTHPRITALSLERAAELSARGEPLACYEAALLVENGVADAFRPLVVVTASPENQVKRAALRDGATEDDSRARVLAQTPLADKVKVADVVIDNDGSAEDLVTKAKAALASVCATLGVSPSRYGLSTPSGAGA